MYYLVLETKWKEGKSFRTESAFVKVINNYDDSTNGAALWTTPRKHEALFFKTKEAVNNAIRKHYRYIQGGNRMWGIKTTEYVWQPHNYNKMDIQYRVKIEQDAQ